MHRSGRMRLLVVIAAMSLVVAACGDDASDGGVASLEDIGATPEETPAAGDATADPEQALLAFAACLRDNGVDIDDPTVDADGNPVLARPGQGDAPRDPEAFRQARDTCEPLLGGVTLGFGLRDDTERQDSLLEFAQCMRDNGYDMPDPDFTAGPGEGGGPGGGPFGGIDFDDPVFQAASEQCSDILAGFGPGQGPGGRGGDDG